MKKLKVYIAGKHVGYIKEVRLSTEDLIRAAKDLEEKHDDLEGQILVEQAKKIISK